MTALNSLCIVGIFTVAGFGVGYAGIIGWKRYISPAIERRQWLREYKRQRALELAAMRAVYHDYLSKLDVD